MNDAPETPTPSGAPADDAPRDASPPPRDPPPLAPADADVATPGWQAPWIATPEHPHGVADLQPPPQRSTGHYGPGYDDPTRHFGGTLPGQEGAPEKDDAAPPAQRRQPPET